MDEATKQPYYLALVDVPEENIPEHYRGKVASGMNAEVIMPTHRAHSACTTLWNHCAIECGQRFERGSKRACRSGTLKDHIDVFPILHPIFHTETGAAREGLRRPPH